MPIYRLVAGFPITQATALSLATISGGSIANLYTYTRRYHPNDTIKRPLIDYEGPLLFCPALLAGTMFGSVFSVMFPPWLTVVLLVAFLGYSGKRTLNKGVKRWKGEDKLSSAADARRGVARRRRGRHAARPRRRAAHRAHGQERTQDSGRAVQAIALRQGGFAHTARELDGDGRHLVDSFCLSLLLIRSRRSTAQDSQLFIRTHTALKELLEHLNEFARHRLQRTARRLGRAHSRIDLTSTPPPKCCTRPTFDSRTCSSRRRPGSGRRRWTGPRRRRF